jgi:hypothetical protein
MKSIGNSCFYEFSVPRTDLLDTENGTLTISFSDYSKTKIYLFQGETFKKAEQVEKGVDLDKNYTYPITQNLYLILVPSSTANENTATFSVSYEAEPLFDLSPKTEPVGAPRFNYGIMWLVIGIILFFVGIAVAVYIKINYCAHKKWIFDVLPSPEELKKRDKKADDAKFEEEQRLKDAHEAASELL